MRVSIAAAMFVLCACGGAQTDARPFRAATHVWLVPPEPPNPLLGTTAVGPDLGGSLWELGEVHCPESSFRPVERHITQIVRVEAESAGLLFTYDRKGSSCSETIVQRAIAAATADSDWTFREEAHVSVPPDCGEGVESDRPGNVRRRGESLETFVQRSPLCGGFDARLVYVSRASTPLTNEEVMRHYVAHVNRRDVNAIAALFSENASFVEPFTLDEAGASVRHEGRVAIRAWFESALGGLPWSAMRITNLERGATDAQVVMRWEYIDPRIAEPIAGKNTFTIAGGEILESRLEL